MSAESGSFYVVKFNGTEGPIEIKAEESQDQFKASSLGGCVVDIFINGDKTIQPSS